MTASLSRARHRLWAQPDVGRRATPVRLRFAAVSIAVLALLTGLVGVLAATQRQSATAAAWQEAEPLMVTAQAVDTSLSDADTTAAASFLQGRVAPAALQNRYQADLTSASTGVAEAARQAGSDPAVAAQLGDAFDGPAPVCRHRPGGRLQRAPGLLSAGCGVPGGGQQPDALVHPAGGGAGLRNRGRPPGQRPDDRCLRLAGGPGRRLPRDALLVALVVAQRRLSRHFRRSWNVALAVATAVVLVLGVWAVVALATQGAGVTDAQANGSHPVSVFTDARILALRARADDELTLLTRDSDPSYQADYDSTAAALGSLLTPSASAGLDARAQMAKAAAGLPFVHVAASTDSRRRRARAIWAAP